MKYLRDYSSFSPWQQNILFAFNCFLRMYFVRCYIIFPFLRTVNFSVAWMVAQVYPIMTSREATHSTWLFRVSSRAEENIKRGFTKTGSWKKAPCRPSRAHPCLYLRIFRRHAWFSFFMKGELASGSEEIVKSATSSNILSKNLHVV